MLLYGSVVWQYQNFLLCTKYKCGNGKPSFQDGVRITEQFKVQTRLNFQLKKLDATYLVSGTLREFKS